MSNLGVCCRERRRTAAQIADLARRGIKHRHVLIPFYELFTGAFSLKLGTKLGPHSTLTLTVGPAAYVLDRWFESEMLKTTLATDAVIGAMSAPSVPGSAYVLLRHVMGKSRVWVRGL